LLPEPIVEIEIHGLLEAERVVATGRHVNERAKLQLRFEVYNAFNHVRFGAPNSDPTSSNFGIVTGSEQNQARAVQLGGRLSF
jgi:hypothetical protein